MSIAEFRSRSNCNADVSEGKDPISNPTYTKFELTGAKNISEYYLQSTNGVLPRLE